MRPGWLYFALFVILAAQGRFISIVLTDSLRLREAEVGWVLGFGIISGLLSTPFWTMRADNALVGCKRVLIELVCLHFVCFSLLPLAQQLVLESHDLVYISALLSRFLSASLISPCNSVLDAYTLRALEDKDQYGKERLFGAVSWAIANILMGFAMDAQAIDPLHVCMIFLSLGSLAFIFALMYVEEENEGQEQQQQQRPSLQAFANILKRDSMLFFLLVCTLVMGCATSLVENLLFMFMRQELAASYVVCGVSVVITVMFEIPLFFVGKSLLLRIGVPQLVLMAMFCYVSRVVVYTLVDNGWMILLVEPLHGVTYALLQTASVAFVQSKCNIDQVAQGQGLLSVFKNIGSLVGTVLGSRILQDLGSAVLFRGMAFVVSISMLILVCNRHRLSREEQKEPNEPAVVNDDEEEQAPIVMTITAKEAMAQI